MKAMFMPSLSKSASASLALCLIACGALLGCGSGAPASDSAEKQPAAKRAQAADNPEEAPKPRKSVFLVKGLPDPFHPEAKKEKAAAAVSGALPAQDSAAILKAGFQAIIGTSDQTLAVIHGAILEPRRSTVIQTEVGGRHYELAVRCLDISDSQVTLQVEGEPRPITLTLPKRQF